MAQSDRFHAPRSLLTPGWRTTPRVLAVAVISTLPGWVHAQAMGPLEIDPGLIVVPASRSVPVSSSSVPAVAQEATTVAPVPKASTTTRAQTSQTAQAAQVAPTAPVAAQPAPAADASGKRAIKVPIPAKQNSRDPDETQVEARHITGRQDVDLQAYEDVRLTRGDLVMTSDKLIYDQIANEVTAEGNVVAVRGGDKIEGPRAHVNLDTWVGEFDTPSYELHREKLITGEVPSKGTVRMMQKVTATGQADELRLEGENHYRLENATYSSCPAPDPDWYLKVRDLQLDYDRDTGTGHGTTLVFKDVPVGYLPWMEFPLTGNRQSGFLPPTIGGTSNTGLDITVPYYFNLAPNYDATLSPRYMSRRGLQLGGEGRYLTPNYNGVVRGEWLPNDAVAGKDRAAISLTHNQDFRNGFSGQVIYNQVSDSDYFADLSSKIGSTSTATLNRQAVLNYSSGTWLTGSLNVQHYQTLTGEAPYDRLPQLTATAALPDFHGFALTLPTEYAKFSHNTKDEGDRFIVYPQIAYPIQGNAFFVTPKIGLHATQYQVERRTTTGPTSLSRTIPIFTVDSGLNFERDTSWNGKPQIQTLEPRLYYVRSGYVDQSDYPVFDTARADFNFAQIFSENVYSGSDRIADANQVTAAVQSRLIDADTGEEWIRGGVGQRYYFSDQRVTLPGEQQRTGRVADILGLLSGRVYRSVWMDSAVQYDPRDDQLQRATIGLRYQPDFAKVASVSYRFKNGEFRDIDLTAQWPLWQRWYGVGRYNYNMRDHRLTEAIAGLEYKADCWVFRGVWQTLLNTKQARTNSFFLQIEFNGLASIGSNPVNLLKRSVSGYGKINSPAMGDPVFGSDEE